MTKSMYLSAVRVKLKGLPEAEIQNAMAYLEEYFEEAGSEREQEVIKELGSPEKVASQIKADYTIRNINEPQTTSKAKKKSNSMKDLFMIIGGIVSLPISIPLIAAIVILILALIITVFAIVITVVALIFAAVISGIVILGVGIYTLAKSLASALCMIGVALMILAVGTMVSVCLEMFMKQGLPALTRYVGKIYRKVKGEDGYDE